LQSLERSADGGGQFREFVADRMPEDIEIEPVLAVAQPIPQAADIAPGWSGISSAACLPSRWAASQTRTRHRSTASRVFPSAAKPAWLMPAR
jgi:hypothetical protein